MKQISDVVIIGAGTAGLTAALKLADHRKVSILCKSALGDGSSLYAQGGIAAVMDEGDSFESHIQAPQARRISHFALRFQSQK